MPLPTPIRTPLHSAARRIGLLPTLRRLRSWASQGSDYEEAFQTAIRATVARGDVVWDVGANVGFYTRQFVDLVGPSGKVVAFEPHPDTFSQLSEVTAPNVEHVQAALGKESGSLPMSLSDASTTHSFVRQHGSESIMVPVLTGDAYAEAHGTPTVIKIDVEGFEVHVLQGLSETLTHVRAVLCEVHYSALREAGWTNGPRKVEQLLRAAGLAARWTDPNHIVATRTPTPAAQ